MEKIKAFFHIIIIPLRHASRSQQIIASDSYESSIAGHYLQKSIRTLHTVNLITYYSIVFEPAIVTKFVKAVSFPHYDLTLM